MTEGKKPMNQSAGKVLDVLNELLGHFAHGISPMELAKATGLEPSSITRYVNTLENKGFAERIPETARIRPSQEFARHAVSILLSIDNARVHLDQIRNSLVSQSL